jgi:putative DNA primase/helicase
MANHARSSAFVDKAVHIQKDGIYVSNPNGNGIKIAEPILVTAFGANEYSVPRGTAYIVVKFRDRKERWRTETVPAEFLTSHRSDFIKLLSRRGYVWPPSQNSWPKIIGALSAIKPNRDIKLTPVPGPCGGYFVLPGESYGKEGPTRKRIKMLQDNSVKLGMFRRSGRLDDWKRLVAKPCSQSTRARLAVAANFAAPNLRMLGLNSFGINFSGMTSGGKTLLLRWAACTSGLNSEGGPTTWDGTPTGFEQRALGHRDCIMLLDDLSYVEDPRALAKLVTFRLSGNRTKDRAGQYVHAQRLVETDYRVIALSTSEDPLWGQVADSAGSRIRGEEVRMINIRADVSKVQDIFDGQHASEVVGRTVEQRRAYVEEQEAFSRKYQGEAFRAYLTKWKQDPNAAVTLEAYMAEYQKVPLPKQERWLARIQRLFAVVYAGAAQAIDYKILPWSKRKTLEAINACMCDAMDQLIEKSGTSGDGGSHRSNQSLLAEFKLRMSDAAFVRLSREAKRKKVPLKRINRAQGIVRPTKSRRCEHLLFTRTMNEWFPDVSDRQRLTKYLQELKLLKRGKRKDTRTRQIFICELGKKVPCYKVWRRRVQDCVIKN